MKKLQLLVVILVGLMLVFTPLMYGCDGEGETTEVIELTYSSTTPQNHPFSVADAAWIDYVYEQTDGRVQITPYWSSTLLSMSEHYRELVEGGADIAQVVLHFFPDQFPLLVNMAYFFHGCPSREASIDIYYEVLDKFPELAAEVEDVKVCITTAPNVYQIISTKPVRCLEDMEGLNLRASGWHQVWVQAAGAIPQATPYSEMYVSLEKGIIDGGIHPWEVYKSYNFAEVAKYGTELNFVGPISPMTAFNQESWDSLPSDIQEILEDSFDFWFNELYSGVVNNEEVVGPAYAEEMDVEIIHLSEAELQKFEDLVEDAAIEVAAELDAKGLPGTELYDEIQRLIAEYS